MKLVDEPTCIRKLTYRIEPSNLEFAGRVIMACVEAGLPHGAELGRLHVFVDKGGHQILVVPTTGRVQIRLLYTVPYAERRKTAEALFAQLVKSTDALDQEKK